ncbi:DUF3634 family protein [Lentisphaera profundi]|uniref:DUF3634 family protein n=1 Tax=Lentisphaera profundi TaxID=1658616 RepID=UPI003B67B161
MNKLLIKFRILISYTTVIVEIENNKLNTKKGKAGNNTLRELREVIQTSNVKYGCILYCKSKKKLKLLGIPQNIHQKLRNVWYNNHRSI